VIPAVAASEIGTAQTKFSNRLGVVGQTLWIILDRITGLNARPKKVRALCSKSRIILVCILSSTGHVKPGVNPAGPSAKAKYSSMTDSEQVP
jgi:hypothetical protein